MPRTSIDRAALREYAQRLIDFLGPDLSRLSGTGTQIRSENRVGLALHEAPANETAFSETRFAGTPHGEVSPRSAAEAEVLEEWLKRADARPLVIVAPFGMGKSVLLASFAVTLARRLKTNLARRRIDRLFVPLPVRLPSWIDFTAAKNDRIPFLQFMLASQQILSPNSTSGFLDWRQFEELRRRGWLLPLFDGFDELPGYYDSAGSLSRRSVLQDIGDTCGHFYCLATRPGAAEEIRGREYQRHEIRELDSTDVVSFAAKQFDMTGAALDAARLYDGLPAHVQTLLRRPLFLGAWCEVASRRDLDTPKTNGAIMTMLVRRCFDKRRRITRITHATFYKRLTQLGHLLTIFALKGFRPIDADAVKRELRDSDVIDDERAMHRLIALAIAVGFVVRLPDDTLFAYKIPVTEFLVGRYLALDVAQHPDKPRRLLTTFQRFLWRPELHDILDHTFDVLWHGSAEQMKWASLLIAWLTNVSRSRSASNDPAQVGANADDFVNPFVWTAVRWLSLASQLPLDSTPSDFVTDCIATALKVRPDPSRYDARCRIPLTNLTVCEHAIDSAWARRRECATTSDVNTSEVHEDPIPIGGLHHPHIVLALLDSLTSRWVRAVDSKEKDFLNWTIGRVAGYLERQAADKFVGNALTMSTRDRTALSEPQMSVLRGAAWQCSEENADPLVRLCISELRSSDVSQMSRWIDVLPAAVTQVDKKSRKTLVTMLLSECARYGDDAAMARLFRHVLWSATSELPSCDLMNVMEEIIERHIVSDVVDDENSAAAEWNDSYLGAITSFLWHGRRLETRVHAASVNLWIKKFAKARGATREAWVKAIGVAATGVNSVDAIGVLSLLKSHYVNGITDEDRQDWTRVLKSFAVRVRQRDTAKMASERLNRYGRSASRRYPTPGMLAEVTSFASCLTGDLAEDIARRLMEPYLRLGSAVYRDAVWLNAICAAMGGMPPESAVALSKDINAPDRLSGNDLFAWHSALRESFRNNEHELGCDFVADLIERRKSSPKSDWWIWSAVLDDAARRVRRADLEDVCNKLISIGETRSAYQVASWRPELAIIANTPTDGSGQNNRQYRAILRDKMTLDERLECAPEAIRQTLVSCIQAHSAQLPDNAAWYKSLTAEQQASVDWFDRNWHKWGPQLLTFWCVGTFDRVALMQEISATGLKEVQSEFEKQNIDAINVSQNYMREALRDLAKPCTSFPFSNAQLAAASTCAMLRYKPGRKNEDRWSARARIIWNFLDLYLSAPERSPKISVAERKRTKKTR